MLRKRRVALTLDLKWPYKRHAAVFAGTQQYADAHGWESIIDEFVADNLPERPTAPLPYDGVIGRVNQKLAERAQCLGLPLVNVWISSPVWKELPGVFPDFVASGRLIAEHLLGRGLRRFAALSTESLGAKQAIAEFRDVVREAGFPCVVDKIPLDPARNHAAQQKSEQRINAWMDQWQPPMGVFAFGDEMGRIVVQNCHRRGWRVPQDAAIVAGANEEAFCLHPRPSLTSIERGYERIGYAAAELLDGLMRRRGGGSQRRSAPTHIFIPPQGLVVRESTDFFAIDNAEVAAALEFIAANCHRDITQNAVAQAVQMETRTLQNRFREVLDRPIMATVRQLRLERAKRELVQSQRSLKEIARAVGFGDANRMYDVFVRELGVTPSEYRKQRQFN